MRPLLRVVAKNFLSLRELEVELQDLTVLVGPNGSGKTNLLSVFRFLGEVARRDLEPAIDGYGGYKELMFRGEPYRKNLRAAPRVSISIEAKVTPYASVRAPDKYTLEFMERQSSAQGTTRKYLTRFEEILVKRTEGRGRRITLTGADVKVDELTKGGLNERRRDSLKVQSASSGLAILRRLGEAYSAPQVELLADIFEELRLFDVSVEAIRRPSRSSKYAIQLLSDASNLGAFLHYLSDSAPGFYDRVVEDVNFVYPFFEGFVFEEIGGNDVSVRVSIREKGILGTTPLSRISFGTLRAIALFAMLNDPNPPRLTCLEEIDHGLYPHALDRLVERLRDASKRTQIIVATHSPSLVNRLEPNELVVLERNKETSATIQPEINSDDIREMEDRSGLRLGELWFSGVLGGNLY